MIMIWIPREMANYIFPMYYTSRTQTSNTTSAVQNLFWEGDSVDIGLARYVGIYRPSERPLAELQAVLTACLYAPLPTSTTIRLKEPHPETIMFLEWVDDYVL